MKTTLRIAKFRELMKRDGLDGYVITKLEDMQYMSGFVFASTAQEAAFLITQKDFFFFARNLLVPNVKARHPEYIVSSAGNYVAAAVEEIKKQNLKNVGFDGRSILYSDGKLLENAASPREPLTAELREIKDEYELKDIREACRIAYISYEHIKNFIKTGMTETEVAAEFDSFMRKSGASGISFLTIVSFGPNAASPHHISDNTKLKQEDAVLMDFGCIYNLYRSDMTRSWWHGSNPDPEYTKIWNITDKAWKAALTKARFGMTGKEIDAIARKIIKDAGYGEYFTHGLGHGVGVEPHEEPYCNQWRDKKIIAENSVFSCEPGVYLPGKFGVRLEETCVMTKDGLKILTKK